MKIPALILTALLVATVPAWADLTERQVAMAKDNAAKQGKLIAFCYQRKLPGGKTDSTEYRSALRINDEIKKAVPSSQQVVTVHISANDKADDPKLPSALRDSSRSMAKIIVMKADCSEVVATLDASLDVVSKDKIKEFEKKVEAAVSSKTPPAKK